ncbi:MAG: phosphate acyltransferase PlsX [Gammaproteobacteria bacterium]
MSTSITIALDAMGGDHGLPVVIPAAVMALQKNPQLRLILVGDESEITGQFTAIPQVLRSRIDIQHASQVVAMDELPSQALRFKKDSSMRVAINLVKNGTADACVSAGNTGALMAIARFVLKTLPGIDRPAIIADLPNKRGKVRMLDLGANVDSTAEHLFQFAVMGAVLASEADKLTAPKVALLNIGEEEIKGNEQIKQAAHMIAQTKAINYIGYVEGNDIFMGDVDVIVCDGFVGNVALKTSEGAAHIIKYYLQHIAKQSLLNKLSALMALPLLTQLKRRIDPAQYNGASLVGLRGIVVKSHGGASDIAFAHAIGEAVLQVERNVVQAISRQIEQLLVKEPS